jgi:hypothetical protein
VTRRFDALLCLATIPALAGFGCAVAKDEAPGELVGAYHIEGALTANSCGSDALPAMDPLSFDVQIRQDQQGRGLWLRSTPPAQSGKLATDGEFSFMAESAFDVKPTAGSEPVESVFDRDPSTLADPEVIEKAEAAAMASCRLLISESVSGTLFRNSDAYDGGIMLDSSKDAGADGDLIGDNEISIRAQSGSDCKRVLAAQGGPFLELPCKAHYDLVGTLDEKK